MKKLIPFSLIGCLLILSCSRPAIDPQELQTRFELSDSTETVTYEEGIAYWEKLDKHFKELNLISYGKTDIGQPLHLAILSLKECNLYDLKERGEKELLLINNAIHPGEPDGVDASMMLARDILLLPKKEREKLLKNQMVVFIPFYNIGGALNRNSNSRANQEGPVEYGFRGNAQNLDLNRDFIKCDSRNAQSFAKLIQHLDPELYIETHVSNGADYQYTMTYLPSHPSKLGKQLQPAMNSLIEDLNQKMDQKGENMSPYVHLLNQVPDSGIMSFYDSPRYSTGYLATLGIPGIITETHMLKPYNKRVLATYKFLQSCVEYLGEKGPEIREAKQKEREEIAEEEAHVLSWDLDSSESKEITFRGYVANYKPSDVSGLPRLYYDRNQPFTKKVKYYHLLKPLEQIDKPEAYILKRGFVDVEQRLKMNKVGMTELEKDSSLKVVRIRILKAETNKEPYEKHYAHYATQTEEDTVTIKFHKGDWVIPMGTKKDRFVMEVLEPKATDSYFSWNFFDAILQQKEWYSDYVFEDKAAEYLKNDPKLRAKYNHMKETNPAFAQSSRFQLFWIYRNSPHYEKEHMVMPVFRLLPQ